MRVITVEQCDLSNPFTANTANGTWRSHFLSHSVVLVLASGLIHLDYSEAQGQDTTCAESALFSTVCKTVLSLWRFHSVAVRQMCGRCSARLSI